MDPAKAELRIWLLGEFRVAVDDDEGPAAAWNRSKSRSLVKLLALAPGRLLHREQLMDSRWPDLPPDAAVANLRKAIHFARRAMGTVLEAYVALGDWDAVRAMLPRACADVAGNALLRPFCERAAGLAAAAAGDRRVADESLCRAMRAFDQLGVRFEGARTREGLAVLCPPKEACALLSKSLDVYEQLGATPSAERVRSLLARR